MPPHRTGSLGRMSRPVCGPRALPRMDVTHSQHELQQLPVTLFGRVFAWACVGLTRPLWEALESKGSPSPRTKYAHTHPLRGRNRRAKFVLGERDPSQVTLKKLRF